MTHRVFIADDEPLARERVIRLLADSSYEVCGQAANGEQALQAIIQLKPDIVLLDIRMPGKDGLETALELSQLPFPPAIIFLTAYDNHLMEAFNLSAQGYLLKPIRKEVLFAAMEKATRVTLAQLRKIHEGMARGKETEFLLARTSRGEERIPLPEILFLQADQKYVVIHGPARETVTDSTLKEIEQQHSSLLRIHRNTLINADYLEALEKGDDGSFMVRLLHHPGRLPVSRRLVNDIREFLRLRNL